MTYPKRILDMCCKAGGAAMGLHNAWPSAHIVGIDLEPQPRYPFEFTVRDALTVTLDEIRSFDFVWASPPCQKYSYASAKHRNRGKKYLDCLEPVLEMLRASGVPYCVENVVGSGHLMREPHVLCGSMFGLGVRRHRLHETNFPVDALECVDCNAKGGLTDVTGHGPPRRWYRTCTVAGNGGEGPKFSYQVWKDAMGIQWMTKQELSQAVPPAYSEYIARQWSLGQAVKIAVHSRRVRV